MMTGPRPISKVKCCRLQRCQGPLSPAIQPAAGGTAAGEIVGPGGIIGRERGAMANSSMMAITTMNMGIV
jgi:hypothetical protein